MLFYPSLHQVLPYSTLAYPPVELAEVDRSCMEEDPAPGTIALPDEVPGRLPPFKAPRAPAPVESKKGRGGEGGK